MSELHFPGTGLSETVRHVGKPFVPLLPLLRSGRGPAVFECDAESRATLALWAQKENSQPQREPCVASSPLGFSLLFPSRSCATRDARDTMKCCVIDPLGVTREEAQKMLESFNRLQNLQDFESYCCFLSKPHAPVKFCFWFHLYVQKARD